MTTTPIQPDWRGLCEELADSIKLLLEMRPADAKPLSITEQRYARACALLAQPEPEGVGPSDEELWELYRGPGTFSPIEFARAAIAADRARWGHHPAPPAEGEVWELVAALEPEADAQDPATELQWATHDQLRPAADLLEQCQASSVPVGVSGQPDGRDPECVKRWPDCFDGGYHPRCCRFPKSCSCGVRFTSPLPNGEVN